jgi:hypothetical protein
MYKKTYIQFCRSLSFEPKEGMNICSASPQATPQNQRHVRCISKSNAGQKVYFDVYMRGFRDIFSMSSSYLIFNNWSVSQ